jgi:hypothetical protein
MLLTELSIIQALVMWTSWLSGSSNSVTQSYAYVSYPLALERLFDNVATCDFNGQGAYYPGYLLTQRNLKTENIDVRFFGQVRDERLKICFSFLFQAGEMRSRTI